MHKTFGRRAGPPYGHGCKMRKSFFSKSTSQHRARSTDSTLVQRRLDFIRALVTRLSRSTAPRPRSCSVGMFTLVLCRPGLIRLPRTYALMCTYLGRILLFENAYKFVPLFPRTCSYLVYKIQFDSNDKLCAWCSWSKRSCRLCSACPNSERHLSSAAARVVASSLRCSALSLPAAALFCLALPAPCSN